MGGCATKPLDLDSAPQQDPPRETPDSPNNAQAETVPQENSNGGEIKKEEPLVDISEAAEVAPKSEVPASESEAVHSSEVTAKPTEDEAANEIEEKKQVTDDVADKKVVQVGPSSSGDKPDAPLVTL